MSMTGFSRCLSILFLYICPTVPLYCCKLAYILINLALFFTLYFHQWPLASLHCGKPTHVQGKQHWTQSCTAPWTLKIWLEFCWCLPRNDEGCKQNPLDFRGPHLKEKPSWQSSHRQILLNKVLITLSIVSFTVLKKMSLTTWLKKTFTNWNVSLGQRWETATDRPNTKPRVECLVSWWQFQENIR